MDGEVFKKIKDHFRAIVGDAMAISVKENKKVLDKLDTLKPEKQDIKDYTDKLIDIEKAIKEQEVAETVSISNPEAITGDLKAGLEGIIDALKTELKNFDKNIVVKNDFSNFTSLFKSSQDKKSIIQALNKIENKIKQPELTDYTLILSDIANALENKDAINILKGILAKDFNIQFPDVMPVDLDPNLVENDRVKTVLPDDQVKLMSAVASSNSAPIVEKMDDGSQKIQIWDSVVGPAGIDDVTNSLQIVDYSHHEIHGGSHYYLQGFIELDDTDTFYMKMVTPDTAKWSHFVFDIKSTGICTTYLDEDATGGMTGGASKIPINNNRNSANTSGVEFTAGVTACTGYTTRLEADKWGADGFKQTIGGGGGREDELILKQDTVYCRSFISGADSNIIQFKASWYEHTNKV